LSVPSLGSGEGRKTEIAPMTDRLRSSYERDWSPYGPAEVASDAMPHIVHEFYDVRWIVAVVRHLAHVANVIVNKLLRQWLDVVVWLPDGERLNKIVHRCGSSAHDLSQLGGQLGDFVRALRLAHLASTPRAQARPDAARTQTLAAA
jgi:hypothetical protein